MNIYDIKERLLVIANLRNDEEAAHSAEDELHQDVLRAISLGVCVDPRECAAECLKSLGIKFARHCA